MLVEIVFHEVGEFFRNPVYKITRVNGYHRPESYGYAFRKRHRVVETFAAEQLEILNVGRFRVLDE